MLNRILAVPFTIFIFMAVERKYHYQPYQELLKRMELFSRKRIRISNKIICKDKEEINEDRRTFAQQMDYDMNNVIFLDEVSYARKRGINDHQRYGYGFTGEDILIEWKHKQNKKRLTTIAAISNIGIIAKTTVTGLVTPSHI